MEPFEVVVHHVVEHPALIVQTPPVTEPIRAHHDTRDVSGLVFAGAFFQPGITLRRSHVWLLIAVVSDTSVVTLGATTPFFMSPLLHEPRTVSVASHSCRLAPRCASVLPDGGDGEG